MFKFINLYNPNTYNVTNPLENAIYQALNNCNNNYIVTIEEGFYNPTQLATELTNKFNEAVTNLIVSYLTDTPSLSYLLNTFVNSGGYTRFTIIYNNVSQKIWFGNIADGFTLTNSTQIDKRASPDFYYCGSKSVAPNFSDWGLPANLGLLRCDTASINSTNGTETSTTPRFFYGDVFPGDNGYWLLPNPVLLGSQVNWVECPNKINLMGPAYFYMELEGYNCIDETQPYNASPYTFANGSTNGIVNSSFAKIAIPTTPISQWFDRDQVPYKQFLPPAERIRKLHFILRYHNGALVDFGTFDYSFTIEFLTLIPQQGKTISHAYNSNTFSAKMT
jgi:hypothetical protein